MCAGLNVMGFDWIASPACTELEVVVLDWLAKFLNLPDRFLNLSPHSGNEGNDDGVSVRSIFYLELKGIYPRIRL